jgi:hypothetical protein
MDLVVRCERVPDHGETIVSTGWLTNPGGKGANQAVQAARLRAESVLVGRVGSDAFGRDVMNGLSAYGVDLNGVMVDPVLSTGVACILVERDGENRIVVVPGANGAVGAAELKTLDGLLRPGGRSPAAMRNPVFSRSGGSSRSTPERGHCHPRSFALGVRHTNVRGIRRCGLPHAERG